MPKTSEMKFKNLQIFKKDEMQNWTVENGREKCQKSEPYQKNNNNYKMRNMVKWHKKDKK